MLCILNTPCFGSTRSTTEWGSSVGSWASSDQQSHKACIFTKILELVAKSRPIKMVLTCSPNQTRPLASGSLWKTQRLKTAAWNSSEHLTWMELTVDISEILTRKPKNFWFTIAPSRSIKCQILRRCQWKKVCKGVLKELSFNWVIKKWFWYFMKI